MKKVFQYRVLNEGIEWIECEERFYNVLKVTDYIQKQIILMDKIGLHEDVCLCDNCIKHEALIKQLLA